MWCPMARHTSRGREVFVQGSGAFTFFPHLQYPFSFSLSSAECQGYFEVLAQELVFAWFPNLVGIFLQLSPQLHSMRFILILINNKKCPSTLLKKSTIICGKNYGQKKVTINYCTPYSTPQGGINSNPKVLVWKITCTQTIPKVMVWSQCLVFTSWQLSKSMSSHPIAWTYST